MWQFLRRQLLYFLVGFVVTFIIYLFVRFSADAVMLGVAIGIVGGAATAIGLFALERRFPGEQKGPGDSR
jgi:hypothetical protein